MTISVIIRNSDQHSNDYDNMRNLFRPSHADFTYQLGLKLREPFEADKTQTLKKLLMMEMQVLPILTKMELTGIHLDSAELNTYNKELTQQIALVEQNIYKEL